MNFSRARTIRRAAEPNTRAVHRGQRMTTVLLIRHGHTDVIGRRLAGRLPGINLSGTGRAEAADLAQRLATTPLAAVYASPLERAVQTAQPLARAHGLDVTCAPGMAEIDFGEWTGRTFDELETVAAWRRFNAQRSTAPVPGGESALDVQSRIVRTLEELRLRHRRQTIAVVTHLDVIRTAILHCAGAPLDNYDRFEVAPASITALELQDFAWRIRSTNTHGDGSRPASDDSEEPK
jgi:broad specificity phosphatase PhoE